MNKANEFNKITVGFVIQKYKRDDKGVARCVSQSFIAGDQCDYETENGDTLDEQNEEYCPFEMIQPSDYCDS